MTGGLSIEYKTLICQNIKKIKDDIAVHAPGRKVTLLGATKTVMPEAINFAAAECGLTDIGENRVQELVEKYPALDTNRIRIHFIGQLQRNKVKFLIGKVHLIHSVDSEQLAGEINKRSQAADVCTDILVEINSGHEEGKGGINPSRTEEFLEILSRLENIRVRGLMTMAPASGDPESYTKYFDLTKKLYDNYFGKDGILSMGMSDSYCRALHCGSNMIRVGSAIFGKRT